MKKVIIYGGAFNPPTRAHQAILQAVVEKAASIDADVWLMLSGQRNDKTISSSREVRIKYAEALLSDIDSMGVNIIINTVEIDNDKPTETHQTVIDIDNKYPGRKQIWVFGSDSISTMTNWRGGEWLLNNLDMLIIQRAGYEIKNLPVNAEQLPVRPLVVSSTEVRYRLENALSVEELVSPAVLNAINSVIQAG